MKPVLPEQSAKLAGEASCPDLALLPSAGFTLIELMVTVAVLAVLAAIAYPSYLAFTRKSNRADATTTMISDAQSMQRCYSQTYDYTNCLTSGSPPAGVVALAPGPTSTPNGYYKITIQASASNLYTITAAPASGSAQASDSQCTQFTLDSKGTQGSSGSATTQTCWGSN